MKKINEDLANVSINTLIAKTQTSFNSFGNGNFNSYLYGDSSSETEKKEESSSDKTLTETQVLYKEAYLNRMMIETLF